MKAHPIVGENGVRLRWFGRVGRNQHFHAGAPQGMRQCVEFGQNRRLLLAAKVCARGFLEGISGRGLRIPSKAHRPHHEHGRGVLRLLTRGVGCWHGSSIANMAVDRARQFQQPVRPIHASRLRGQFGVILAGFNCQIDRGAGARHDGRGRPGRQGAAARDTPQRSSLPAALDKLSPEQYRSIHFNPEAGIWRAEKVPFRLELLRAGYNLQTAVTVSTVEDGVARNLVATPAMFQMAPTLPALGKVSLPLSGFRIRSRINSNKVWDEFLVFQGASYYRAVAKNLLYGLSARGLAIDTGEPSGEEFPAFTHFWVVR